MLSGGVSPGRPGHLVLKGTDMNPLAYGPLRLVGGMMTYILGALQRLYPRRGTRYRRASSEWPLWRPPAVRGLSRGWIQDCVCFSFAKDVLYGIIHFLFGAPRPGAGARACSLDSISSRMDLSCLAYILEILVSWFRFVELGRTLEM